MAFYLAFKEIWYNKGRFLLIATIVALITTLVLFIAALAEGLGSGNREYLQKLNGELIIYQENVDLSINASRIGRSKVAEIRRVAGVVDLGQIGFSSATLVFAESEGGVGLLSGVAPLDIALIGVEPGRPGEPPAFQGRQLGRDRADEAILDRNAAIRTGLQVGDPITVKVIQGTDEEFYTLTVVGISDGRQYSLAPSIFVPYLTWEQVRPQANLDEVRGEIVSNVVAVKLENPTQIEQMTQRIEAEVSRIEVADRKTAYESTPGYTAQQSTLDTQRYFTLFIGILVVGGFFQIQTLQKVAQIGMLKAIGMPNRTVVLSALTQIVTINALGVLLGLAGSLALSLTFPPTVPIIFSGQSAATAVALLMIIGPIGGLVSVWLLLRVEPLTALGLAQ
jgi:putative ABC transport system permease protein